MVGLDHLGGVEVKGGRDSKGGKRFSGDEGGKLRPKKTKKLRSRKGGRRERGERVAEKDGS